MPSSCIQTIFYWINSFLAEKIQSPIAHFCNLIINHNFWQAISVHCLNQKWKVRNVMQLTIVIPIAKVEVQAAEKYQQTACADHNSVWLSWNAFNAVITITRVSCCGIPDPASYLMLSLVHVVPVPGTLLAWRPAPQQWHLLHCYGFTF